MVYTIVVTISHSLSYTTDLYHQGETWQYRLKFIKYESGKHRGFNSQRK